MARALTLVMAIGLAAAGLCPAPALAAPSAEPPADPPEERTGDRTFRTLRVCDPTACYIAWRATDSDHDGVSDADELMAGTDPHDPRSRPGLEIVVELASARELPSFEAGLGSFVLFPPEIVEMRTKDQPDLLGAFPVHERADSLTRLGISADLMGSVGVDPARSGMTVGLDHKTGNDGMPGRRVNGMDMSLISAGTQSPTGSAPHGGVKGRHKNWLGDWVTDFNDGSSDTWSDEGGGHHVIEHTNADGSDGGTRDIHTSSSTASDGTRTDKTDETSKNGKGETTSESHEETHTYPSGASSTIKVVTEYKRDADGNVTGTTVTTTVGYISSDGNYGSESKTVESCDANGGNCTEVSYEFEDSDTVDTEEHVNPDADADTIVTEEMVDGALRLRGAEITVVQGWEAPGNGQPENPNDPGTLILVDPEQALEYTVLNAPRVTTAQPEYRDDLPNPLQDAPPPEGGGGEGNCRIGIC
jgi:hypothetical protein